MKLVFRVIMVIGLLGSYLKTSLSTGTSCNGQSLRRKQISFREENYFQRYLHKFNQSLQFTVNVLDLMIEVETPFHVKWMKFTLQ